MIVVKHPRATAPNRKPLTLLLVPQKRASEKKQLVMYSHAHARHKKAHINPSGPAMRSARTNKNILVPLLAMILQSKIPSMEDLEKGRLKRLLIASSAIYAVSLLAAFMLIPLIGDLSRIDVFIKFPWIVYSLVFLTYCWMPLSVWTFFQGLMHRRRSHFLANPEDLTVPSLAIAIPVFMWFTYLLTRVF